MNAGDLRTGRADSILTCIEAVAILRPSTLPPCSIWRVGGKHGVPRIAHIHSQTAVGRRTNSTAGPQVPYVILSNTSHNAIQIDPLFAQHVVVRRDVVERGSHIPDRVSRYDVAQEAALTVDRIECRVELATAAGGGAHRDGIEARGPGKEDAERPAGRRTIASHCRALMRIADARGGLLIGGIVGGQ